jgi:hypothetical protein
MFVDLNLGMRRKSGLYNVGERCTDGDSRQLLDAVERIVGRVEVSVGTVLRVEVSARWRVGLYKPAQADAWLLGSPSLTITPGRHSNS